MDSQREQQEYGAFLQRKVERARASARAGRGDNNEDVEADFAARRSLVDREEERHRMTLEALSDVRAGRLIDQRSIKAWTDSLLTDRPLPPPAA